MPNRPNIAGSSAKLREGRVSEAYSCYAITKVVQRRRPILATPGSSTILLESLRHLRAEDRLKLFAFCVMPDHLHIVFCLMPGEDLSKLIASFSKHTGARLNRLLRTEGRFWQERFHDRRCRDRTELSDLCEYVEHNPVRAGFVKAASEWASSSASPECRDMLDREWWP